MKIYNYRSPILVWAFFVATLLLSCKHIKTDPHAITKSEETNTLLIKHLIDLESKSFYSRNYDRWSDCYKQDENTCWVCVEDSGLLEARGWQELSSLVKGYMQQNPRHEQTHIARDNYHIQLKDNIAWVTFDEHQVKGSGEKVELHGVRILELIDNEWKIAYMNSYPTPDHAH